MLVFDQQSLKYSTDRAKVVFIRSLQADETSAWDITLANSNSVICQSIESFTTEIQKVFDHLLQSKEASSFLFPCAQVRLFYSSDSLILLIFAF